MSEQAVAQRTKNKITVASYLTNQIDSTVNGGWKTQKMISEELGYSKPNIITMFKQGLTNLPINKVPAMAKAIHVDPVYLLRLTLSEYMPEAWQVIEELLGRNIVTKQELDVLKFIRENSGGRDLSVSTEAQKEALRAYAATL